MAKSVVCLVLMTALAYGDPFYQNRYDSRLYFRCSKENEAISYVHSTHDDGFADRKFRLACRDIDTNINGTLGKRSCTKSDYWENLFDDLLMFNCDSDQYIIGMESEHSNYYEDRRWKFTCCGFDDLQLYDCYWTFWTNKFDMMQYYSVPKGMVITGVISIHSDLKEDRRYKYNICQIKRRSSLINDSNLSKTEKTAKCFCQGQCTKEHLCSNPFMHSG